MKQKIQINLNIEIKKLIQNSILLKILMIVLLKMMKKFLFICHRITKIRKFLKMI